MKDKKYKLFVFPIILSLIYLFVSIFISDFQGWYTTIYNSLMLFTLLLVSGIIGYEICEENKK